MSERITRFVDVVVPVPVHRAFTYRVPFELNDSVQAGFRVIVPFGTKKLLTGIIVRVHETPPETGSAKYLDCILDDRPIIHSKQLEFWSWMSKYYSSAIGEVMNAALPSNLKLASESLVIPHPDFDENAELDDRATLVMDALQLQDAITIKDVSDILGIKTVQPLIKQWLDKRWFLTLENLKDKYTPKTASYIRLHSIFENEAELSELLQEWDGKKGKKTQQDALLSLLSIGKYQGGKIQGVAKKELESQGVSNSTIKTLEKNGVIEIYQEEISRLSESNSAYKNSPELTPAQNDAFQQVRHSLQNQFVCLLHGVTGSGKTEIYIHLIEEQLKKGKQVLFLVPEIALTTQLIERLSVYFGNLIGVYHSKYNQNERIEIWNKVLHDDPNDYRIILGARSSIFLPFSNLGLVIVDEEQESSFKQHDPSPRYHGRDAAIFLAHLHNSKVVLGSATPSMESYWNAQNGKYGLVELKERYKNMALPEILVADLKKERQRNKNFKFFSEFLLTEIKEALDRKEQVILFQNRRGYNPRWSCEVCSWTPHCVNCDVSLTYHKNANLLKCHYCGHTQHPVGTCGDCGSTRLKMIGYGTEKIEDEMSLLFPKAVVGRLDLDTTRSKHGYEKILQAFGSQQIDILIGTQMISKGLDFDNVQLVGILDADSMLNRPDFRAYEKAFQMMTQVAGRAGRKNKRGKVIVQTGQVDHWVIEKVYQHDYEGFYQSEIIERQNFYYPPFTKIIDFNLKHRDERVISEGAMHFADQLKQVFGERVLGPEFALIPRINNRFIKVIKLKMEKGLSERKVKEKVQHLLDQFYQISTYKSITISMDVDPQ